MQCGTSVAIDARPLEPAGDGLRALLAQVTDYVVELVDRLPGEPASDHTGVPELQRSRANAVTGPPVP